MQSQKPSRKKCGPASRTRHQRRSDTKEMIEEPCEESPSDIQPSVAVNEGNVNNTELPSSTTDIKTTDGGLSCVAAGIDMDHSKGQALEKRDVSNFLRLHSDEEYAVQHFGFAPSELIHSENSAFQSYIKEGVTNFTSYLQKKLTTEEKKVDLSEQRDFLIEKYIENSNPVVDKYTSYMRKEIFHIPPNLLLPEDAVQAKQYNVEEQRKVDQDIVVLHSNIMQKRLMIAKLKEELEMQDVVLSKMDAIIAAESDFDDQLLSSAGVDSIDPLLDEMDKTVTEMVGNAAKIMADKPHVEKLSRTLMDDPAEPAADGF